MKPSERSMEMARECYKSARYGFMMEKVALLLDVARVEGAQAAIEAARAKLDSWAQHSPPDYYEVDNMLAALSADEIARGTEGK